MSLGVNPAHGLRKVHGDRKPHEPWPAEIIEAFLAVASEPLRLALYLLLYTGQRVGDVVKMAGDRVQLVQEKTGQPINVNVHERLAAVLKDVSRINEYIRLFGSKNQKCQTRELKMAKLGQTPLITKKICLSVTYRDYGAIMPERDRPGDGARAAERPWTEGR